MEGEEDSDWKMKICYIMMGAWGGGGLGENQSRFRGCCAEFKYQSVIWSSKKTMFFIDSVRGSFNSNSAIHRFSCPRPFII